MQVPSRDLQTMLRLDDDTPIYMPPAENEKEIRALDDLFAASARYHRTPEYMDLLAFIGRMPKEAPYNCMLLHIQNPAVSFVATPYRWWRDFGRKPKRDARPLVVLRHFGPVDFVFDLKDTEGDDVPEGALRPFATHGRLDPGVFDCTVANAKVYGVTVRSVRMPHSDAGIIQMVTAIPREARADFGIEPWARSLILLNVEHSTEDRYATLTHELAHLFAGHCGTDGYSWWDNRSYLDTAIREFEAESVAYLTCLRHGLTATSERYLADYRTDTNNAFVPQLSLHDVIDVSSQIERMGRPSYTPRKAPKSSTNQPSLF